METGVNEDVEIGSLVSWMTGAPAEALGVVYCTWLSLYLSLLRRTYDGCSSAHKGNTPSSGYMSFFIDDN